jgi:hypothetical protein
MIEKIIKLDLETLSVNVCLEVKNVDGITFEILSYDHATKISLSSDEGKEDKMNVKYVKQKKLNDECNFVTFCGNPKNNVFKTPWKIRSGCNIEICITFSPFDKEKFTMFDKNGDPVAPCLKISY